MRGTRSGNSVGKWIGGVAAAVVGGVLLLLVTQLIKPDPAPPTSGTLDSVQMVTASPCCEFAFRVSIKGYNSQQLPVYAQIIDNDSGAGGQWAPVITLTPSTNDDTASEVVTVPVTRPGNFYVRFVLNDPNGGELARAESEVFPVSS